LGAAGFSGKSGAACVLWMQGHRGPGGPEKASGEKIVAHSPPKKARR